MDNEWVVIARYLDDLVSQEAVYLLMENDIEAVTVDKRDSIYKFGDIELCVHRDDVMMAKKIIKDLQGE